MVLHEGGDLGGDDIVDAELELAQGRDEAAEGTEVDKRKDTTAEADAVEETSVAHPAEHEGGLQAEDVVELEEVLVGTEGEERLEGVKGKGLVDNQVLEDLGVEAVETGEVGKVQVLEAVGDGDNIEAGAELDTGVELVESTEREVALLLLDLLGSGGRGSEGGESADEDASELHFDS